MIRNYPLSWQYFIESGGKILTPPMTLAEARKEAYARALQVPNVSYNVLAWDIDKRKMWNTEFGYRAQVITTMEVSQ